MSARTRDWLKFGTLVLVAFVLGVALTSGLELPKAGAAAEPMPLIQATMPPRVIPAAKPVADLSDAFATVAENVKRAVVFIRSERRQQVDTRSLPPGFEDFFPQRRRPPVQEGTGSGFIVSTDGYILTNNHVVAGAEHVTVRLLDKREFTARVVGADPATDVAVIKIDARDLPTVSFGNSDSTRIGEWVLAIGNPLGEDFTFTVTAGIVSAKGRLLPELAQVPRYSIQDFIQTDAAINPGNSGGPLVDVRGAVIGINAAIASETGYNQGYGFAVPINLARTVMDQLIRTGRVQRAVMGVQIRDAAPEDAELFGLKDISGDLIVALDGQPVGYVAQLQQRVGFKKPGETIAVTVVRAGGVRKNVTVRLAAAPDSDSQRLAANTGTGSARAPHPGEQSLGISVQPLTQEDLQDDRLQDVAQAGGGLAVTDVAPDGPAYTRLASNPPDIILGVNGKPVRTREQLRTALQTVKPGDIVTLQVYSLGRAGREVIRLKAR
jgi:serine protease Do